MVAVRTTWAVALAFLLGFPLTLIVELRQVGIYALPRSLKGSGPVLLPLDPDRRMVAFAVFLLLASHLVPRSVAPRRLVTRTVKRFHEAMSYRDTPRFDLVATNADQLARANEARATVVFASILAFALGIAWICFLQWQPTATCCWGPCRHVVEDPLDYLGYFGIAILCLLSHVPRLLRSPTA